MLEPRTFSLSFPRTPNTCSGGETELIFFHRSAAVRYGDSQIAIFHVPRKGYFATQQMCPHKRAFVLDHGIVGDDPNSGAVYVSCPMHKRNFTLKTGQCLNDDNYSILAFDIKVDDTNGDISLLLPEPDELDAVIGSSKWMVRQATAELYDRSRSEENGEAEAEGRAVEIVGPGLERAAGEGGALALGAGCGNSKLEW